MDINFNWFYTNTILTMRRLTNMSRTFIINVTVGVLLSFAIMWYLLTRSNPSYSLVIIGSAIATICAGTAIAEVITGDFQDKGKIN